MKKLALFTLVALVCSGLSLNAALVSTGIDANFDLIDDNWTVTRAPFTDPSLEPAIVSLLPPPGWVPNDSDSRWIRPWGQPGSPPLGPGFPAPLGLLNLQPGLPLPGSTFIYTATFGGTPGIVPAGAYNFRLAADDILVGLFINGIFQPGSFLPDPAYGSFSPWISSTAFLSFSTNTVIAIVINTSSDHLLNPSGFRAEIVPEPGTYVLVGLGLAGLALYRRRRRA